MPVFNLQLVCDDKGAVVAIRRLNEVAGAAGKAESSLSRMTGLLSRLPGPIGMIATALGAGFLKIVNDANELSSKLQALENQLRVVGSRAGWSSQEISSLESAMRKNGVGAVDARKNVIALAGAYVDAQKALPLFSAALDATVISGKNVNEVLQTMTGAIESGNSRRLESLGFQANFNDAYKEMAASLKTSVSALTEQEKVQARVDAVLKASATNAGLYEAALSDSEKASQEMSKALESLKLELVDAFSPETTALVNNLAGAVNWLCGKISDLRVSINGLGAKLRGELSDAEYAAMDKEGLQKHFGNYQDETWLKQQRDRAQAEANRLGKSVFDETGAAELERSLKAVEFYDTRLKELAKKRARETAQTQREEKQRESKHNSEKQELGAKADQAFENVYAKSKEGRLKREKQTQDELIALQKRALDAQLISEEEYARRVAIIRASGQASDAKTGGARAGASGTSLKSATVKDEKAIMQSLQKELFRLEGNTSGVEAIEQKESLDAFRAKLADIRSLSQEEKDILLNRYEKAADRQSTVENLQVSLDFLKEIESISGDYGGSLEIQNQLIANQAELYRSQLPASMQGYVSEWERLQRLQKSQAGWDGALRGVMKFGAEYGNLASQVEGFTMQMGSTISNTLADAFMKGKFSAQDFFNSLVGMAAQAASNYFIGMLFRGMGGFFGGGANYSAGQTATMNANGMQWSGGDSGWLNGVHGHAKGGVFSGISAYSGSIVNRPTFFNYSDEFRQFARGGGLMGEAGPEAIMPLSRMADGSLGVKILKEDIDSNTANLAILAAAMRDSAANRSQAAPNVSVNIINNSNAKAESGEMRSDGKGGFTMDVIISEIERNVVGRMKQGKSQIAQYQEHAYGFNRAPVIARSRGRN